MFHFSSLLNSLFLMIVVIILFFTNNRYCSGINNCLKCVLHYLLIGLYIQGVQILLSLLEENLPTQQGFFCIRRNDQTNPVIIMGSSRLFGNALYIWFPQILFWNSARIGSSIQHFHYHFHWIGFSLKLHDDDVGLT